MRGLKSHIDRTDWQFGARNEDDDFHTDVVFLRVSTDQIRQTAGIAHRTALLRYRGYTGEFYYPLADTREICTHLIDRLLREEKWAMELNSSIRKASDDLARVFAPWGPSPDFSLAPLKSLLALYQRQLKAQISLYKVAWIAEILQAEDVGLTTYLYRYLGSRLGNEEKTQAAFFALTASKSPSVFRLEATGILDLAKRIVRNRELKNVFSRPLKELRLALPHDIRQRIEKLAGTYGVFGYHGYGTRQKANADSYLLRVQELVLSPEKLSTLDAHLSGLDAAVLDARKLARELKIDREHRRLFRVYSDFAPTKAARRLAQLTNFFYLDKLLAEFARRLEVPESWLRFMTPEEIVLAGRTRKFPANAQARTQAMLYVRWESKEYVTTAPWIRTLRLPGPEGTRKGESTTVLRGLCASPGHAIGRARIVRRGDDRELDGIDAQTILVSIEADPDLVEAISRAGAVVTDQGGITCHVAVIARELNTPCVTGTRVATATIRSGDLVEVDANAGIVKILERAPNDPDAGKSSPRGR